MRFLPDANIYGLFIERDGLTDPLLDLCERGLVELHSVRSIEGQLGDPRTPEWKRVLFERVARQKVPEGATVYGESV